ncbi:MAG: hypothetical protein R6W99_05100 [Clostridia bacterium]
MAYSIFEVTNNRLLRDFINFPYRLYKDDPNWVPLLKMLTRQTVKGKNNALFSHGTHITYVLKEGGTTVARLIAGIDEKANTEKDMKRGYITLFECINDKEA